jgi:PII-like signaling protein
VIESAIKLTAYFGERDRAGDRFLADALLDLFDAHGVATSILMRGAEGFGLKHHLRTDRLLSLSEDLPVVAVAVDAQGRIEALLPEVERLVGGGLVTLERARMIRGEAAGIDLPAGLQSGAVKLTTYLGRQERAVTGEPAYLATVERLRSIGIDGATVQLGVDGTRAGERRRARFFSRNADVPLMVISVGQGELIAAAVGELEGILEAPLMTLERVRICKRDGRRLADPGDVPATDESGLELWQKLMLYTGEQQQFDGHPVHVAAVRRLREAGAAGATALRGIWGYHGMHTPHGDAFWALRRRVPVVTVAIDRPPAIRRWLALLDALTPERGLITSEVVPAVRATAQGAVRGGFRLATRWKGS